MAGGRTTLAVTACLFVIGTVTFTTLLMIQRIEQSRLPTVDPRSDVYSTCIGKFLTDMTTYTSCLDKHAGKTCLLDDNRMTTQEDSHNCLALITAIPSFTLNALVLRTAHDVCYIYLKSYSECLGLAVQIDDLEPCLRREVFARVGTIVDQCKNKSGIHPDENVTGPSGLSLGNSFGPGDKMRTTTTTTTTTTTGRRKAGRTATELLAWWVRLFRSGGERGSDADVFLDDVELNIVSTNSTAQQRRSNGSALLRRSSGVRQRSVNEEMVDSYVSFSFDHEGMGAGGSF